MSNKSSINGKYVGRTFTTKDMQSDEFRKVRYDAMIPASSAKRSFASVKPKGRISEERDKLNEGD